MADQSLLESIIEHDSDKLLVYGAFILSLAIGSVFGSEANPLLLVPVFILAAFTGLIIYHYRRTVHGD